MSYTEIAQQLQVSRASIGSDLQYIREQAKANIKEYTTDHLPEQYQVCLAALDTVLKNAFVIVTQSHDNREKLSALQLFKDTHITELELLSNATTIDSALNFIRSKQQEQHKKHLAEDTNNAAANLDTHKVVNEAQGGRQTVF